jgi:hypothetical protein
MTGAVWAYRPTASPGSDYVRLIAQPDFNPDTSFAARQ